MHAEPCAYAGGYLHPDTYVNAERELIAGWGPERRGWEGLGWG